MSLFRNILLLFLSTIFALFALDKIYEWSILQNKNEKLSYIISNPPHAKIVISGPCEPLWTIDPDVIEMNTGKMTYNLASTHSDFAENYLSLFLYLQSNDKPECVLLYVTPESFDSTYNLFNTYRFACFVNQQEVRNVIKDSDQNYYKWHSVPFMRFCYYNRWTNFPALQGLKHYKESKQDAYFPNGYEEPISNKWDAHLDWFKEYFPTGYRFKISPKRLKYLNRIDSLCKAEEIPLILYESPFYKSDELKLLNRDSIINFTHQWAASNNRKYLVFDSMAMSTKKENFISLLVLNREKGKAFSDSLGKYLNRFQFK